MNNPDQPESMFKSEGHRVIFGLVEASGKSQQEQLGITRMMYESRTSTIADHWYTKIAERVKSTECSEALKATALNNLNTLYKQMRGFSLSLNSIMQIPTEGLIEFVAKLAKENSVVYVRTALDDFADAATKLSGDDVTTDDTCDLIVSLFRAKKIRSKEMVTLIVNYQRELKTKGN